MNTEFNCSTCNKSFTSSRRLATHTKTHLVQLVIEPADTVSIIAFKNQNLSELSKAELIEKCAELGLTKVKSKTKVEIIGLIEAQKPATLVEVKEVGIASVEVKEVGVTSVEVKEVGSVSAEVKSLSLKPLVKWSGGKSDEIKQFEKYFPANYDSYLEPFIGGGSVYFNVRPKKAVISDVHEELVAFYQSIKDGHANKIHEFMQQNLNDELTYYKVRDKMAINSPLDNAMRFYYLRKTCFRGMLRYNKQGKFNIPFGKYNTINYSELLNPLYTDLLTNTLVVRAGFEFIFENYNDENNFMFLDPPYDSEFTDYGYCKFGKEEQKKLAKCFKETKIKCLMIIGKTDFIVDLYKDYIVDSYKKNYKFKLYAGRVGSEINTEHLIIMNYNHLS
jgi:DNA adenine methylase